MAQGCSVECHCFAEVCDREIGSIEYHAVWREVRRLSYKWKSIATCLGLSPDTINTIEADCGDSGSCLHKVLDHWLKKDYDYNLHGVPSWRMLAIAVKEGGGYAALAEEIAHRHPLLRTSVSRCRESGSNHSIYVSSVRNFPLLNKIYELQMEFADIIQKTRNSFKPQLLSKIIDYLETHAMMLLGPHRNNAIAVQAIRDEFHHIQSIDGIFQVLQCKYVSWFNYELLVKLVDKFLAKNHSLRRRWSAYKEKLKDYLVNSGGLDLQSVDGEKFGASDIPGTQVMVAKVDRDDYTSADLFFFRRAIPRELDMPHLELYFCHIHIGSLHLHYCIPNFIFSLIFPLREDQLQRLAGIGITEFKCGEFVYDLKKQATPTSFKHCHQPYCKKYINIETCDPLYYENTSTPLHEACWRGLIDEVQWLIDKFGYSTFHRGLNGWTPLHSASYGGHIEILQLLIDQDGIDPNEGDDNSVSSLHMASYNGHLPVVQYLVDTCHVPPDQRDSSNNTALLYSAQGGHIDLVSFFLDRQCSSSQYNYCGASLSLLACQSGAVVLVNKLEDDSLFDPSIIDYDDRGVLHYASLNDNPDLFEYLLTHYQLSINSKDRFGRCPLYFASQYASSAVAEFIINKVGKEALLITTNDGSTCLHAACDLSIQTNAGVVCSKLSSPRDAPIIQITTGTNIRQNIDFLKRIERMSLVFSFLEKASNCPRNCPNFDVNASTAFGESLLHLACSSGSTLLVKTVQRYNIVPSLDYDSNDYNGSSLVHHAAWSGSKDVLDYVIAKYLKCSMEANYVGNMPLDYLCCSGSINAVQYLLKLKHSDTIDNGIYYSCRHGHLDLTRYLIESHHCNINTTDSDSLKFLHDAALSNNMDLVQYLINEKGLVSTAVDKDGCTALHYASMTLNLSLAKVLVTTYKLSPHKGNNHGMLPLHYAAISGDTMLLDFYVKFHNCNLTVADNNEWNIFHYSASKGHMHFIEYTIEQYPHCEELLQLTNNEGKTTLHFACESGNTQLVAFLIDIKKCDVNAKSMDDSTCMMYACASGNLFLLQLLNYEYKLNPLATNEHGLSTLLMSAYYGHIHVFEWLVDIRFVSYHVKETLAHLAAACGRLKFLKHMIENHKCDVNAITTHDGSTVLHEACRYGHNDTVFYLTSLPQCNVQAKTNNESTVLHLVCDQSGSLPILKHFITKFPDQLNLNETNDIGLAPIHYACKKGRLDLIECIMECTPSSLEVHDCNGFTPVHIAIFYNHLPVVQYFISKDCNTSAVDSNGFGPVHISAGKGYVEIMKYLIDSGGCDPNSTDRHGRTPLHIAVINHRFGVVEYLLDSPEFTNPRINIKALGDIAGNTPLHHACQYSNQHKMIPLLVKALHSLKVNIKATNNKGQTPLHMTAISGQTDNAKALLSSISNDEIEHFNTALDNEGYTAIQVACSKGHYKMLLYLCETYPRSVHFIDDNGRDLLHLSCQSGSSEMVQSLIETYQLNPESSDKEGITCLHLVAEKGDVKMYQYIWGRQYVANPVPLDNKGRTPLHYACSANQYDMALYLINSYTCTPDDPDFNGYNSVHASCKAGSFDLVLHFLTVLGCDPLAETNDHKTLMDFACKSSNMELVWFLKEVFGLQPDPQDTRFGSPAEAKILHDDSAIEQKKAIKEYYKKLEGSPKPYVTLLPDDIITFFM